MSEGLTKVELSSLVSSAVSEAMKVSALECPECQAVFTKPAQYLDHRLGETLDKKVAAATKTQKPEEFLAGCKDGICKIVDDHIKEKYDIAGEGEEGEGLFSLKDDPE